MFGFSKGLVKIDFFSGGWDWEVVSSNFFYWALIFVKGSAYEREEMILAPYFLLPGLLFFNGIL